MRVAVAVVAGLLAGPVAAQEWWAPEHAEFYGSVELEGRGFFEDAAHPGQRDQDASVALEITALAEWNDGDTVFTFTPFLRLDRADDARTHADIRELKLEQVSGDWAFTVGVDREFWGRTEVVHLVDIVNQTDAVESLDDEDRLGQPLVKVSRLTDLGEFSVYYFPYARERTFPGVAGRLRLPPPYVTTDHDFEPGAGQWTPSVAGRFTGVFGAVDLGLSVFHGVSRDPAFRPTPEGRLLPTYQRITQGGVDAQFTSGATLWKGEAIVRTGQRDAAFETQTYGAVTAGLEHTLYQVGGTPWDLGLILEGAYDSRGDRALTAFENDVILGTRLTLNDTQDTAILLTASVDAEDADVVLRLEAERRLTPTLTAAIEAQGFLNAPDSLAGQGFGDDSFVRIRITRYF